MRRQPRHHHGADADERTLHIDLDSLSWVSRRLAQRELRDGYGSALDDGVQRVLGREPSSFEDRTAREARALNAAQPTAS